MKLFQQLDSPIVALLTGEIVADLQHRHQVVVNTQAAEDRGFLRQVTDTAACAGVQRQDTDIFVIDHDAPGVALNDTDHHVESGGLAGTVWPQQADDLARFHFQAHVFNDFAAFVGFRQVFCDECCHK
jgi:hypothetical protein